MLAINQFGHAPRVMNEVLECVNVLSGNSIWIFLFLISIASDRYVL